MVTSVESAARIMGPILQAVISSQSGRFACRKCTSHISDQASLNSLKGSMLIPVLYRCGHEFGFDCLSSWLSPNEGQNSCPSCRHELFPTAPDIDDGFAQLHHDDIVDVYFDIAASIHSSLSASAMPTASRIEHRSPGFRDWLLYSQLQAQESSLLPPWRPTSVDEFCPRLNAAHEEALFQELRRRRAFRVLPIPGPVGSLASEREIWNILREQGYYYAPLHAPTASGCFWTRM